MQICSVIKLLLVFLRTDPVPNIRSKEQINEATMGLTLNQFSSDLSHEKIPFKRCMM